MITLKMLAAACNVSVATVSKALNGASEINAETAAKIQKKAEEMGYVPSASARLLKTNRSYSLGVILQDGTSSGLTHEYFTHILDGFMRQAEEKGYDINLFSATPGAWGPDYLSHAHYRHTDGVAVLVADQYSPDVLKLTQGHIPLVTLDSHIDGCSSVYSDNMQGMVELVNHVYDQGHRKIAAMFGEECPVTRVRKATFLRTLAEHGVKIPDEYVVDTVYHRPDLAAEKALELLSLKEPPTCILFPDDYSLIGAIGEIEKRGLRIPEDLSVAGYDGSRAAMAMHIATVCQDTEAIGRAMATALIRNIEESARFLPEMITIPCSLAPGNSVRRI